MSTRNKTSRDSVDSFSYDFLCGFPCTSMEDYRVSKVFLNLYNLQFMLNGLVELHRVVSLNTA